MFWRSILHSWMTQQFMEHFSLFLFFRFFQHFMFFGFSSKHFVFLALVIQVVETKEVDDVVFLEDELPEMIVGTRPDSFPFSKRIKVGSWRVKADVLMWNFMPTSGYRPISILPETILLIKFQRNIFRLKQNMFKL